MTGWFSELTARAMEVASQGNIGALAALFLMVSLTEVGVPFPLVLDTTLFLLGYQLGQLWWQAIAAVLVLLLGRESGSTIVYWLSHALGNPVINWSGKRFPSLRRNLERLTKKLGIRASLAVVLSRLTAQAPLAASISSFGGRVSFTVAIARLTPGLLTATSIASGTIGLRYGYFALGIALASIFVDAAIIALGAIMGYGLLHLGFAPSPWLIIVGLVVNIALIWSVQRLLWRRNSGREGDRVQEPQKREG